MLRNEKTNTVKTFVTGTKQHYKSSFILVRPFICHSTWCSVYKYISFFSFFDSRLQSSNFSFQSRGPGPGPILGATRVSMPNGISFRPTALAEFTSVTDGRTDRPRYVDDCHNSRHHHHHVCSLRQLVKKQEHVQ